MIGHGRSKERGTEKPPEEALDGYKVRMRNVMV
jgi:hypothetical protein